MVIEPRVVQFWSEIILVISNRTRAARSFDFAQIALHSVQLPLFIKWCEWSKYPSQQKSTLVTLLSQMPCQGRELNF